MISAEDHMFREHSAAELVSWTRRLVYFRFKRAQGGQAQDGDYLVAGIGLRSSFSVLDVLKQMGWTINAKELSEITARPEGIWFRLDAKFGDPEIFQLPSVRLRSDKKILLIEISGEDGDPYSVSEADVALAEELENLMQRLHVDLIAPTWLGDACFCEASYPQCFAFIK